MKKGRSAAMIVSKPQIWAGIDPIQSRMAGPSLLRHFLDRKERAEHRLLAIEIELVGGGETMVDFIAQRGPARRISAGGEALHHLPLPGDQIASLGRSASR